LCGKTDFYFAGHDHNRQILTEDCQGTHFVVSGAGGKVRELPGQNHTVFQEDTLGFLWVEASSTDMTLEFINTQGEIDFSINYQK